MEWGFFENKIHEVMGFPTSDHFSIIEKGSGKEIKSKSAGGHSWAFCEIKVVRWKKEGKILIASLIIFVIVAGIIWFVVWKRKQRK